MTVTMTLEEYQDLQRRAISKEKLQQMQGKLIKASMDFARNIGPGNTQSPLNDFRKAVNTIFDTEPNIGPGNTQSPLNDFRKAVNTIFDTEPQTKETT
jgi:hypothetical protein